MQEPRPMSAVEQRRKLLKGALAASGVVTMGYSGAALASFDCITNIRVNGGAPGGTSQFRTTAPSTTSGEDWAWVKVSIHRYKIGTAGIDGVCTNNGSNQAFDAFKLNDSDSVVYKTSAPTTPVSGAYKTVNQPNGYPLTGYVLAYFDDGGGQAGSYPTYTIASQGHTPATSTCLASVNPGLDRSGLTFGG